MTARRVRYCERSTIVEAWAVVAGFPARSSQGEASLVEHYARKALGGLVAEPALVVHPSPGGDATAPFWFRQVRSADRGDFARFGHRFLAAHFVGGAQRRYQTFQTSLRPWLGAWLQAIASAHEGGDDPVPVARVGFGYVNEFDFAADGFDLGAHFKASVGVGLESTRGGVGRMELVLQWLRPAGDAALQVALTLDSPGAESRVVRARTRVVADAAAPDGSSFRAPAQILDAVQAVKEIAKETFFELATEALKERMGAVHEG